MKTKLESDKENKKKKEEDKKEESPKENKDHEGSGKHEKKCPKGKKNCDCSNVKGGGKKNIYVKKKRKESDWIKLVKSVRKSENLSYKDALKVRVFCESSFLSLLVVFFAVK